MKFGHVRQRHGSGFNMVMCDGSVQRDQLFDRPDVHRYLGNRKDGQAISAAAF